MSTESVMFSSICTVCCSLFVSCQHKAQLCIHTSIDKIINSQRKIQNLRLKTNFPGKNEAIFRRDAFCKIESCKKKKKRKCHKLDMTIVKVAQDKPNELSSTKYSDTKNHCLKRSKDRHVKRLVEGSSKWFLKPTLILPGSCSMNGSREGRNGRRTLLSIE